MEAREDRPSGDESAKRGRLLRWVLALAIVFGGYHLFTEARRWEADRIAARDLYDRQHPYTRAQRGCDWFEYDENEDLPGLFRDGRLEELAAGVDRLQKAVEKDSRCDRMIDWPLWAVADAVASGGDRQGELLGVLDLWTETSPDSYIPWMLRGRAHVELGYKTRGRGLSRNTSAEQWQGMRDAFSRATHDMEKALELNPRAIGAYFGLLKIAMAQGPKSEAVRLLDAAIAAGLPSYRVFEYYMDAVNPRWGGSFDLIETGIERARPHMEANPTLRTMIGHPYHVRAYKAYWDKDYKQAADLWKQALQYARFYEWHYHRGKALRGLRRFAEAIAEFDEVIALNDEYQHTWFYRAKSNMAIGQLEEAIHDFEREAELHPDESASFTGRASAYERAGRYEEALADLYKAKTLKRKPSAWNLRRIGDILYHDLERYAAAEVAYAELLELYPDETRGWLRYGMALHHQGKAGAKEALEHYLSIVDLANENLQSDIAQARRALGLGGEPGGESGSSLPGLVSVMGGAK